VQGYSLPAEDLEYVLAQTCGQWEELRGGRLFVTGGTGFFGAWLVESFLWANEKLALDASVTLLTRNPQAFFHRMPHLAQCRQLRLSQGDVRSFAFPEGSFSHVIHAAATSTGIHTAEDRLELLDTIIEGTRRVLQFACQCRAEQLLLVSSGAVYGRQPAGVSHISEDYTGAPDPMDPTSSYGQGKRAAEHLGRLFAESSRLQVKIARPFALIGPYLPLDAHFAAGNFIRDALLGGPIRVQGDGTPYRSYLYAADLAVWLWTIFFRGVSCRPYNVGSEAAVTIGELASMVASQFQPPLAVEIAKEPSAGQPPERYVPSCFRASNELDLRQKIVLPEALRRTIRWHAGAGGLSRPGNLRADSPEAQTAGS